jgi:hypothetical protein
VLPMPHPVLCRCVFTSAVLACVAMSPPGYGLGFENGLLLPSIWCAEFSGIGRSCRSMLATTTKYGVINPWMATHRFHVKKRLEPGASRRHHSWVGFTIATGGRPRKHHPPSCVFVRTRPSSRAAPTLPSLIQWPTQVANRHIVA